MKIGQLAAAAGVHVETIRYYQRMGLIPEPARRPGVVRRYGEEAAERLRFIRRAQALGFSLEEVRHLLALASGEHCTETRRLAKDKLALVEAKLSDLGAMRDALAGLVSACTEGDGGCPIIDRLKAAA